MNCSHFRCALRQIRFLFWVATSRCSSRRELRVEATGSWTRTIQVLVINAHLYSYAGEMFVVPEKPYALELSNRGSDCGRTSAISGGTELDICEGLRCINLSR